MTPAQETLIAAAIRSSNNATVVAALAIRDDVTLTTWLNEASNVDAWNSQVSDRDLYEATDITKFDNLTAGKRESWRMMMDFAPIDFGRVKFRKATQDTWGNTDSVAVLQACTRKATRAENIFGGVLETTNTVGALDLSWTGSLGVNEVSLAITRNP